MLVVNCNIPDNTSFLSLPEHQVPSAAAVGEHCSYPLYLAPCFCINTRFCVDLHLGSQLKRLSGPGANLLLKQNLYSALQRAQQPSPCQGSLHAEAPASLDH